MKKRSHGSERRAWDWLFADGECPICGRRHSSWIRRLALWFDGAVAA